MNSNYFKRCTMSDKNYHFSIRKLNVGVVSVAISAFMFLGCSVALADSTLNTETPTTVQVTPTVNNDEGDLVSEENTESEPATEITTSNSSSEEQTNTEEQSEVAIDNTNDVAIQGNDSALSNGEATPFTTDSTTEATDRTLNENVSTDINASELSTNTQQQGNEVTATEEEKTTSLRSKELATDASEATPVALADSAETQDGYTLTVPESPISDPVEGRYTFQVIQDSEGYQYVFSIDKDKTSQEYLTGNKTARYVYVTRMKDGTVESTKMIDREAQPGTVAEYGNTEINLLSGSKTIQIATKNITGYYTELYNALSTSGTGKVQSINISSIRLADQVTKYVNELTGEVIHEEYIQSGWTGYEYTTKPIEIENYKYIHATTNVNGIVSTAVPRNKGDIVYLTAQTRVTDTDKETPVTIYRKLEFIDDNQTAKVTIYMSPKANEGEETDAKKFFENMDQYNIYNNKIYTSATDMSRTTNSGVKFSDVASNDRDGYYLARPYADTPEGKTPIQVFLSTSSLVTQNVDQTVRFTLPYADTGILLGDGVNNRLQSPNRKVNFSTVVYYYMPQGEVVVNYVDTDGNVIKDPVTDTELTVIQVDGKPVEYNTIDKRENTIKTPDGKTYRYKEIKSGSAPETGELQQGKQEVTYVYEEVKGDVVVLYRTEDGKELTGVGSDYEGQPDKTMTIGNVSDTETVEKKAWNGAVIDTPTGSTGVDYTTTDNRPETITTEDGLVYKRIAGKVGGSETGKVVEGTMRIVYYYEAQKGGAVNARYVIEGTEEELQAAEVVKPEGTQVGTEYMASKPSTIIKDGRTYILSPTTPIRTAPGDAPETGRVTEQPQTIVYQYVLVVPKGNVTIHYEDEAGNVIKDPVKDEENVDVGTPYDTTDEGDKPNRITTSDGKTYELVPDKTKGEEHGTVVEGNTDVTYVYREVKGDVVVTYVDTDGNIIKDQVIDTPSSSTGTTYDTSEHAQKSIIGANGKRYLLVKAGNYPIGTVDEAGHLVTSDATTGEVSEGTKTVTYVYQELGSYIPYIPQNPGDPYDPTNPGTDEPEVPYDETPEEPGDNPPLPYIPGYTPKDPNGDPLKPVDPDDPTKGYIPPPITDPNDPGKDTPVPYEKDPDTPPEVKQGDVIVKYVNEKGETIAQDVTDTPLSDEGTEYDTTDNKPRIINGTDGKRYIFTKIQDGDSETG
ncbi:MucBP domain-containing protein, partial [uncultured Ligilactobacillus sp.]|uniref:MucBP domain-containing protein n=1 Tax=uncultured Ligilactobacillus sp. TaxID=2837633 RepID=UPI00272BBB09